MAMQNGYDELILLLFRQYGSLHYRDVISGFDSGESEDG
jgi:hypothetical protein